MLPILLIDILKSALILALIYFIIGVVIKQDLKKTEQLKDIEEVEKNTEVVYFPNMSQREKYKMLNIGLKKIEKCLPCEQKLNDFFKCLIEVRKLKQNIDRMYENEQIQLDNAISWLEKPMNTRGKYKPVSYDENDIDNLSTKGIEETLRLITSQAYDCTSGYNNVGDVIQIPKSESFGNFNIPLIKLDTALKVEQFVRRNLPVAKAWTRKLFHYLFESLKIWYVLVRLILKTIFKISNLKEVLSIVSKYTKNFLHIQTTVDRTNDATTVDVELLPEENAEIPTGGFFSRLIAKLKSYFQN